MALSVKQNTALGFTDAYFDKDFWPVLIFFVGRHQQIAGENRHKAIAFGFKVDRSITTQKTAQSLGVWGLGHLFIIMY